MLNNRIILFIIALLGILFSNVFASAAEIAAAPTAAPTAASATAPASVISSVSASAAQVYSPSFPPAVDYEKVSLLTFPETASWTSLSKLPIISAKLLRNAAPALKKAYFASQLSKEPALEGKYCSFIKNLLDEKQDYVQHFYLYASPNLTQEKARVSVNVNINANVKSNANTSVQALIYAGPNPCVEGNAVLIWLKTQHGYVVKQDAAPNLQLLRIRKNNQEDNKEGASLQFSSVAIGCCLDPIDVYSLGDIANGNKFGKYSVNNLTHIPSLLAITPVAPTAAITSSAKLFSPFPFVVAKKELILRYTPERNDVYDKGRSEFESVAIIGNVVGKYLPGCSGEVVAEERDKNSQLWYFVTLNESCKALCTYHPYDYVNVGWIEASEVDNFR